nr:MAG: transcriptional regulator, SpoVT/AbrB family [Candidatus Nanosalinarum sp. J07AB56]
MTKVELDSSGRVYLPKEVREGLGERFRAVKIGGGLRLIPVPDNPVEDLRTKTSEIRESDESVENLRKEARKRLQEDAGG